METSNRGRWFWLGAVAIMVLITAQIDWDWLWFPALISNASSTVLIQLNNRISQEGLISIIVVDPAENGSKIGHMQIKAITQIRSKISLQRPNKNPFEWRHPGDGKMTIFRYHLSKRSVSVKHVSTWGLDYSFHYYWRFPITPVSRITDFPVGAKTPLQVIGRKQKVMTAYRNVDIPCHLDDGNDNGSITSFNVTVVAYRIHNASEI